MSGHHACALQFPAPNGQPERRTPDRRRRTRPTPLSRRRSRSGRSRTRSHADPASQRCRRGSRVEAASCTTASITTPSTIVTDDRLRHPEAGDRGRQDRRHQVRLGAAERHLHVPRLQPDRAGLPARERHAERQRAPGVVRRTRTATPTATTSSTRTRSGSTPARCSHGVGTFVNTATACAELIIDTGPLAEGLRHRRRVGHVHGTAVVVKPVVAVKPTTAAPGTVHALEGDEDDRSRRTAEHDPCDRSPASTLERSSRSRSPAARSSVRRPARPASRSSRSGRPSRVPLASAQPHAPTSNAFP